MTWIFGADMSFTMTLQGPGGSKSITGKYHTGWGDAVYMDHLSEKVSGHDILKDEVTISGNQLTAQPTPTARRPSSPSGEAVRVGGPFL